MLSVTYSCTETNPDMPETLIEWLLAVLNMAESG